MGAYKDTITCPSCGYRVKRAKGDYDDYCPKCGEFLEDFEGDGYEIDDDVSFDDSDMDDTYHYNSDFE